MQGRGGTQRRRQRSPAQGGPWCLCGGAPPSSELEVPDGDVADVVVFDGAVPDPAREGVEYGGLTLVGASESIQAAWRGRQARATVTEMRQAQARSAQPR